METRDGESDPGTGPLDSVGRMEFGAVPPSELSGMVVEFNGADLAEAFLPVFVYLP